MTTAEGTLVDAGREAEVLHIRRTFQQTLRPDTAAEIFVMDRRGLIQWTRGPARIGYVMAGPDRRVAPATWVMWARASRRWARQSTKNQA